MRRLGLIALTATAVSLPAPAEAFAFDSSRDNQMVCRRGRPPAVGTHLQRPRICRTRAEWRQIQELTENEIQQIRDGQTPASPVASAVPALDRTFSPGPAQPSQPADEEPWA